MYGVILGEIINMRPVCIKCNVEMQCEKNGVVVYHPYEEPKPGPIQEKVGNLTVIHTDRLITIDKTKIDFVVRGDKYKCPICGYEVVVGFGQQMVDYQYPQEQLKKIVTNADETIEIRRVY